MRECLLRAGLSRTSGSSDFTLGNPKSWLGTAYHEVLEKSVEVDLSSESLEDAVERLWNQAIADQEKRVSAHVLNRRFGLPPAWPGYHLARASVLLRAQELASEPRDTQQRLPTGQAGALREHEFTAFDGRLVGRPDVIRDPKVIDYKSGAILERDDETQTDVVKAAYQRQLRIYGYLVRQNLGWWPEYGILLPLGGAGVEIALEPSACEREANEAVALLESYQVRWHNVSAPTDLASPSPNSCKWCPFKLICPSFWQASGPTWSGEMEGAAVEGVVVEPPRAIQGGAARTVALEIQAGSEVLRRAQIAPLSPATHLTVSTLAAGDRVRLTGLRVRADQVLAPTQRTVLARVIDLPTITLTLPRDSGY
jgi:hypothetical protein